MDAEYPNPVVTFLPVYGTSVLLIQRSRDEKHWPGRWAFPGGKVEIGETFLDALARELTEETALTATGRVAFLDTYMFGTSVGVAFAITVSDQKARAADGEVAMWIDNEMQLKSLERIPGIDNHFARAQAVMKLPEAWIEFEEANLIEAIYRNR